MVNFKGFLAASQEELVQIPLGPVLYVLLLHSIAHQEVISDFQVGG
jgi:hypothetical protein